MTIPPPNGFDNICHQYGYGRTIRWWYYVFFGLRAQGTKSPIIQPKNEAFIREKNIGGEFSACQSGISR